MIANTCVIFGGVGFIGVHFCEFLLKNSLVRNVVLADIKPLDEDRHTPYIRDCLLAGDITIVECDVRLNIKLFRYKDSVDLIVNLAAIHREPGHEPFEYYETNLTGARNVCDWAESVDCNRIIFTSSIAPYGPSEAKKNEESIPVPASPYGGSKLVAEKMHEAWQHKDQANRCLVIVRPGVVFGAGEGGNVSRMVKAVLTRYFFYMGNRSTRKAGVYVKELCNAMVWVLQNQEKHQEKISLFNMTMTPAPSMEEYVDAICEIAMVKRTIPSMPFALLFLASQIIDPLSKMLGLKQPVSPVRIKKLVRSNDIEAKYLNDRGYGYKYTLVDALGDWRANKPQDWACTKLPAEIEGRRNLNNPESGLTRFLKK